MLEEGGGVNTHHPQIQRLLPDTQLGDEGSPIRKLSAKDRLVGPALLAQQYGLDNSHLAKAIATGYAFDYKEDEQAVEIQGYIAENGIEQAVEKYSGLTQESALYQKVIDAYKAIKA